MIKKIAIVLAAAAALWSHAALATETNFKPANMSGTTPAEEGVSRPPRVEQPKSTEPTFWDKEGKRSGLADTAQGMKSSVFGIFKNDWFKDQEEKYKARKGSSTDK